MKLKRLSAIVFSSLFAGWALLSLLLVMQGERLSVAWIPFRSLRLQAQFDESPPQIQDWARLIKSVTTSPKEQFALAEQLVAHRIAYTSLSPDLTPTVAQVLASKQGNCVAQSLVLGSLCRALALTPSVHTRADHAWISCKIDSTRFDALSVQMRPELAFLVENPATFKGLSKTSVLADSFTPVSADLNQTALLSN